MNLALSITHAAFDRRRVASLARLKDQLKLADVRLEQKTGAPIEGRCRVPCFGEIAYHEEISEDPQPPHAWSLRQWKWGAAQPEGTLVLYLQDDVIVAPDFWERLERFLGTPFWQTQQGSAWLNLLTHHPGSRQAFLDGWGCYTTVDGLMGCAYAAYAQEVDATLFWRQNMLVPGIPERLSEDVLLSLYCMWARRPIVTPLPGLVDHDLDVGTIKGVEQTAVRRAYVRWDDADRLEGPPDNTNMVLELGRFYETAHSMLPGALIDSAAGLKLANSLQDAVCPPRYARFFERLVAQKDWP